MPEKKSMYSVNNLKVLNRCFEVIQHKEKIIIFISAVKYAK